jgi:hypothetical protein
MATTAYSFDDLNSDRIYNQPAKPIWSLDLDDPANDKEILNWLLAESDYLAHENEQRIRIQRRNLALYKGIQYQESEARAENRDRAADRSTFLRKIVANHLFDLTKNRASRLIKFRPAVAILPTNDELEDKLSAKACKALLDHIWYENDFEGQIQLQLATHAMIMGESYLFVLWNPDMGPINPAYLKARKKYGKEKIPLMDADGQPVKDNAGNPRYVDKPVRVGDVDYQLELSPEVLLDKAPKYEQVRHCFVSKVVPIEELRIKYPELSAKIKSHSEQIYDYDRMELRPTRNEVKVYTFLAKKQPGMEKGRRIVFTRDCILENEEAPWSHDGLPFIRFTDIDFPGELYGHSFFEIIKGLTGTYNNLTNMILRNILLVSHPKWMVPAGSVALEKLGNDITIVQYKGPTPPTLGVAQTTPPEVYKFRDQLKEEFQQIAGVFGVSRGEPPPGIKAGVALQFLSEQESERYNELVLKWNECIRAVAELTLSVAADGYDESDERMVRVVGKNNEYLTEFFRAADLNHDYDIRIQNSSALPKSVAARTQTLLDLSERFPQQFTGEQVIDMLDLAQSDKFIDGATVAVRSAEAETEKLLEVTPQVAEAMAPQEFENHLIHWRIHTKQIQEFSFKYKTQPEKQKNLVDHVFTHEMFMVEQAKVNPKFAEMLAQLELFPMFYKIRGGIDSAPTLAQPMMMQNAGMADQMAMPPLPPVSPLQANNLPVNPALSPIPGEATQPEVAPLETQLMGALPPVEPTRGV